MQIVTAITIFTETGCKKLADNLFFVAIQEVLNQRVLVFLHWLEDLPFIIKPTQYCLVTIQIPDAIKFQTVAVDTLKNDWMSPSSQKHTQRIGDLFVEKNEHLVLKVPSVIVPGDSNYLMNPLHPNFEKVKILKTELFSLDSRLFN